MFIINQREVYYLCVLHNLSNRLINDDTEVEMFLFQNKKSRTKLPAFLLKSKNFDSTLIYFLAPKNSVTADWQNKSILSEGTISKN